MSILASLSHRLIYAYRLRLWLTSTLAKKHLEQKISNYFIYGVKMASIKRTPRSKQKGLISLK
jgi:hypothetical protein